MKITKLQIDYEAMERKHSGITLRDRKTNRRLALYVARNQENWNGKVTRWKHWGKGEAYEDRF